MTLEVFQISVDKNAKRIVERVNVPHGCTLNCTLNNEVAP